jgi:hypothetical protein
LPGHDSDDITRTYAQLAPDTIVGRCSIIEKFGAGGMGEGYLAEDTKLDRNVALKRDIKPSNILIDSKGRAGTE